MGLSTAIDIYLYTLLSTITRTVHIFLLCYNNNIFIIIIIINNLSHTTTPPHYNISSSSISYMSSSFYFLSSIRFLFFFFPLSIITGYSYFFLMIDGQNCILFCTKKNLFLHFLSALLYYVI